MKYNEFLPRSLFPWSFFGQGANFWTHGQILKFNMSKWGSFWCPDDWACSQLSYYDLWRITTLHDEFLPWNLFPWTFLGQGANFCIDGQILKCNMSKWGVLKALLIWIVPSCLATLYDILWHMFKWMCKNIEFQWKEW